MSKQLPDEMYNFGHTGGLTLLSQTATASIVCVLCEDVRAYTGKKSVHIVGTNGTAVTYQVWGCFGFDANPGLLKVDAEAGTAYS